MAKKTNTTGKVKPKKDAADQLKDFMIDGIKDLYLSLIHILMCSYFMLSVVCCLKI